MAAIEMMFMTIIVSIYMVVNILECRRVECLRDKTNSLTSLKVVGFTSKALIYNLVEFHWRKYRQRTSRWKLVDVSTARSFFIYNLFSFKEILHYSNSVPLLTIVWRSECRCSNSCHLQSLLKSMGRMGDISKNRIILWLSAIFQTTHFHSHLEAAQNRHSRIFK